MQQPDKREGFSQTLASLAPKPQPALIFTRPQGGGKVKWEWQYCRASRAWEEACELYQLEEND